MHSFSLLLTSFTQPRLLASLPAFGHLVHFVIGTVSDRRRVLLYLTLDSACMSWFRISHDQLMLPAALALNWIAFLTPKLLLDNVRI